MERQIHCIQFGSGPQQETNNFMMEMARQNGGSYRYINVTQWNRNEPRSNPSLRQMKSLACCLPAYSASSPVHLCSLRKSSGSPSVAGNVIRADIENQNDRMDQCCSRWPDDHGALISARTDQRTGDHRRSRPVNRLVQASSASGPTSQ